MQNFYTERKMIVIEYNQSLRTNSTKNTTLQERW